MLQNQPRTTPLFQTSLRSWRANYIAQQQSQTTEQLAETEQAPVEEQPQRVKRLAPRRRKKRQAAKA